MADPFSDLIPANDRVAGAFDDLVPEKKKFGLGDTWPAKLAKGIYDAATLPGDAMQGKFAVKPERPGDITELDVHNQDQLDRKLLERTNEMAGVVSPISPAARMGVGWAGALKTKDAPAPTREALETASNSGYDAARGMPFEVKADAVRDWASKMKAGLESQGKLSEFAPDTHTVLDKLASGSPDAIATGGNLISAREALREASRNFTNPREKAAAEQAIREFDKFVSGPPEKSVLAGSAPAFAETAGNARRDYASLSRSEQIAEALRAADLQAGSAHSGQNLDNATRQRFKSILLSDKNSAGYSPDEIAQMERIVKGSNVGDAARGIGKFLGGGGGLAALHASATGATAGWAMGGPIGAAVGVSAPIAGYGIKKYGDYLTKREVNKLDEMVRRRSALGDDMPQIMAAEPGARQKLLSRLLMMEGQPLTEATVQP